MTTAVCRRALARGVAATLLASLGPLGCASAPTSSASGGGELVISPEAAARADEILALVETVEPPLTEQLVAGAERLGVQLHGLEYRRKSRASLERKIETGMIERGLPADEVRIEDAIRYTVLVEDTPPGKYDDTVRDILGRVESRGYAVETVKNYWRRGDTYSGLNTVLAAPEGILVELQFHTIGSLAAKAEGHHLYERLRLPTTPIREKRRLYDQLAERWSWVLIPEGILVEGSVHEKEQIRFHERP